MIMPFWSADLYLRCGLFGTEYLGEFALLFSSGVDPISGISKLWTPSGGDPSNGVRFIIVFEWGKSHQWRDELGGRL